MVVSCGQFTLFQMAHRGFGGAQVGEDLGMNWGIIGHLVGAWFKPYWRRVWRLIGGSGGESFEELKTKAATSGQKFPWEGDLARGPALKRRRSGHVLSVNLQVSQREQVMA